MNRLITIVLLTIVDLNYINCDDDNLLHSMNVKYVKDTIYTEKDKTAKALQLWANNNNCTSRLGNSTHSNQLKTIVRAYAGSAVTLPCRVCTSPVTPKTQTVWMYAQSTNDSTLNLFEEIESTVSNGDLTLYYARAEHAGVYQCRAGRRRGGLVLLEVTDDDTYNVVKPLSSHGPYPAPPEVVDKNLLAFTVWSPWSECSSCELVGRRRRYGICFVAYVDYKRSNENAKLNNTNELVDDGLMELFHAYPQGIPCRSEMLPPSIRKLTKVERRHNEIMIGLCKVPCKDGIFELRSTSGGVLERANNTAGVYSLHQTKPLQPPPTITRTLSALPGANIRVNCPGTSLRDIPVTWRIGSKPWSASQLEASSHGRVHLNARDHIVINSVEYADANVYSCWQADILAGIIKLEVSKSEQTYKTWAILLAVITLLVLVLGFVKDLQYHRLRTI